MADFKTSDDVAEWVKSHGVDDLRDFINSPMRGSPRNRQMAERWLKSQEAGQLDAREEEKHVLLRRQTLAAEASADSARRSASWAMLSVAVSVAALLVAAWPYLSSMQRP